jgi:hypothetical protein
MARLFAKRMVRKYVILDFHPLVFFYGLSFALLTLSVPLTFRVLYRWLIQGFDIPTINTLAVMLCLVVGLQSLFFAMLFDMEYNRNLR